jgi:hypothetical protein
VVAVADDHAENDQQIGGEGARVQPHRLMNVLDQNLAQIFAGGPAASAQIGDMEHVVPTRPGKPRDVGIQAKLRECAAAEWTVVGFHVGIACAEYDVILTFFEIFASAAFFMEKLLQRIVLIRSGQAKHERRQSPARRDLSRRRLSAPIGGRRSSSRYPLSCPSAERGE